MSKNRQLHADKVHPFKKKKPRWITQEEFKKTLYASRSEYCEEENDNYSKNNRQINDAPKNEYKQT
ncbi:MAG: hypothetical protein LBC74_11635 [Planctomycetaceae bacterium]|nr:hypothetical protein [Planctomycetaceae bacterium]